MYIAFIFIVGYQGYYINCLYFVNYMYCRTLHHFQFDDVCLVAAIAIMEKSELGDQARGNAVHVLRALSRVVGIFCFQYENWPMIFFSVV